MRTAKPKSETRKEENNKYEERGQSSHRNPPSIETAEEFYENFLLFKEFDKHVHGYRGILTDEQVVVKKYDNKTHSNESRIALNLCDHPAMHHGNIAECKGFFHDENSLNVIYKYYSGGSLQDIVTADKQLSEEVSVPMMSTIGRTLEYVQQQGYVHGDLKPANILLTAEGEPILADGDQAQKLYPENLVEAMHAAARGTLGFMGPAQICRHEAQEAHRPLNNCPIYDKSTDSFGFTCSFYQLMTSGRSHNGTFTQDCAAFVKNPVCPPDVSPWLCDILIYGMTAKSGRIPTISQIVVRLNSYRAPTTTKTEPISVDASSQNDKPACSSSSMSKKKALMLLAGIALNAPVGPYCKPGSEPTTEVRENHRDATAVVEPVTTTNVTSPAHPTQQPLSSPANTCRGSFDVPVDCGKTPGPGGINLQSTPVHKPVRIAPINMNRFFGRNNGLPLNTGVLCTSHSAGA